MAVCFGFLITTVDFSKLGEETQFDRINAEVGGLITLLGFGEFVAESIAKSVDNYAGMSIKTNLGNNATLYQLDGALNGTQGRFEWIIQNGNTTHSLFVPNGTMKGVPIKP